MQRAGQVSIIEQDGQCTYKRNIEARSRNYCYHARATCVTYSEFMSVGLVMQHAKHTRLVYCLNVVLTVHHNISV
jgi:hypothetical protein